MNKSQAAMRRKQGSCPKEVEDALAFLHWMIGLVEARGLAHVEEQFALTMTGMADKILGPRKHGQSGGSQHLENVAKAVEDAREAIAAGATLLEELPHPCDRVPTSFLKGAVMMIETAIREGRNRRSGPSIQQQTEVQP
jgi:hypothetical protein